MRGLLAISHLAASTGAPTIDAIVSYVPAYMLAARPLRFGSSTAGADGVSRTNPSGGNGTELPAGGAGDVGSSTNPGGGAGITEL